MHYFPAATEQSPTIEKYLNQREGFGGETYPKGHRAQESFSPSSKITAEGFCGTGKLLNIVRRHRGSFHISTLTNEVSEIIISDT